MSIKKSEDQPQWQLSVSIRCIPMCQIWTRSQHLSAEPWKKITLFLKESHSSKSEIKVSLQTNWFCRESPAYTEALPTTNPCLKIFSDTLGFCLKQSRQAINGAEHRFCYQNVISIHCTHAISTEWRMQLQQLQRRRPVLLNARLSQPITHLVTCSEMQVHDKINYGNKNGTK